MIVYLGADDGGYELKDKLKDFLETKKVAMIDLGGFNVHAVTDEEVAREVGEKVLENQGARGILVSADDTMCQIVNKLPGIKAVMASEEHDGAQIICVNEKEEWEKVKVAVEKFLRI